MRWIEHSLTEPALNLALEEVLLRGATEEIFVVWRNSPAVIVGRNQNTLAEVDSAWAASHNIPVVRRLSGGGAVYHDLGNINYTHITNNNSLSFAEFTAPLVRALRRLGVLAEFSGRNDLTVYRRKFSGTARVTRYGNTLFHGTLLFRTDLDTLERVLTPAAEKLTSKGVTSVRSRVTNLAEWLPPEITTTDIMAALRSEFSAVITAPLTATELAAAELLAEIKYRQWAWNIGAAPACQVTRSQRFASGGVTVSFTVEHGKLTVLVISGDFFGTCDVAELAAHLIGTPLRHDALTERITSAPFHISDAIEGITPDDFISLLL